MKITECLLGIDFGTSSIKTALFDIKGKMLVFASEPTPFQTPKSGWAEKNADDWWAALIKCTHRLLDESGIPPASIIGMSVDTTCCTVMMADENMNILRPAIMWMDVRASRQAKEITATGHPMLKYNGFGNVSAESMPAKVLWLKQNEPELYNKAKYVFECTDWLMYKLTKRLTASISCAGPRWYYDRPNGGWPVSFYESFGLGDVLDKFPKEVLDLGVNVGGLTRKAADELGLMEGIPVGEGGADAFVGMVGLNVVEPGNVAMITGSSHLHLGLSEKELHAKGMWGSYPDAIVPGLQLVEGGQTSTGSIINWFVQEYCCNQRIEAEKQGKQLYTLLNEQAAQLPIGSEGLIVLDYFQGNRTPYADPDVRGTFYGLSLKHTPAHLFRAIMEAICFGTEAIMQSFKKGGMSPTGIYISGGAAKSGLWMQMHADVCNLPIYVPDVTEAPCLGSAILGAAACGLYPDIPTAAKNMVNMKNTVTPDAGRHREYMKYYEKYRELYGIAKDWMHSVTVELA